MNVNRKKTNPNFVRQDINKNMLIPFGKMIYYSDLSIDIYLLRRKFKQFLNMPLQRQHAVLMVCPSKYIYLLPTYY